MPSLEVQLRIAAEKGDLLQVQELLAAGAHPDGVSESNGRTPLMRAVHGDHREIVRLLLERGADPNRETRLHGTAMDAVRSPAMVRLLQAHGATQAHRLPSGDCKLCGGDIDCLGTTGHWDGPNSCGVWLEGRCTLCGTRYGATHGNGKLTPWSLPKVFPEWLTHPFLPGDVEVVSEQLRRYPAIGKAWQQFLDHQKPGDQLWRYQDPSQEYPSVALLRHDIAIEIFSRPGVKL